MYEIKEFYGKDILRFNEIRCELFRCNDKDFDDRDKFYKKLKDIDAKRDKDFVRIGAFKDDNLYAAMESYPYFINFDGNILKMSGIGNVVSLPNSPEKGAIKTIYKELFKIMRKKGQFISHLYPFNANYYRQYGYEITTKRNKWNIPIEYIPKSDGETVYYDGSTKMQNEIKKIYTSFSSQYNLSVVNTDKDWDEFFENNKPYITNAKYIHYLNGVADAFMTYTTSQKDNRPQDFIIEKLWFNSMEGLKGILSYFITQRPYGDRVILNLPSDIDLSACMEFVGGWGFRNLEANTYNDGTTKVIDVEQILKYAKCKGNGKITVKITKDEYCPWNEKTFTLYFGDKNTVEIGGEPDIEMDINAFSSLILGRMDIEKSDVFDSVKIIQNIEELKKVFYKKECFIEEHF